MSESKHFEDYLRGGSELSRRYRDEAREGPPPELDEAILRAARAAVRAPRRRGISPFGSRRNASLSLAAVVVVTVTVVVLMPDERASDPAGVRSQRLDAPPPTAEPAARPAPALSAPERDSQGQVAPAMAADDSERKSDLAKPKAAEERGTLFAPGLAPPELSGQPAQETVDERVERVGGKPSAVEAPAPARESARKRERHDGGAAGEATPLRQTPPSGNSANRPADADAAPAAPQAERRRMQQRDANPPQTDASRSAVRELKEEAQSTAADRVSSEPENPAGAAAGPRAAPAAGRAPASPEAPGRDPQEWLDEIQQLLDAGEHAAARREFSRFNDAHPDYEVAQSLLDRLAQ